MSGYFLGLDVGATKTHALLADATGRALGFARAGPGNQQTVGYAGMGAALRAATTEALAQAGLQAGQIRGAGFGIGGYDWPVQRPRMLTTVVEALALQAPLALVNDAVLGLFAGTEAGWGLSLVAGTSNNCRGRDPRGREGRVTGDGSRFGEYGGADELVMKALHAVVAAWSRRGPPTALTAALLSHVGASDADDLLEGLALDRYHLGAEAAPLVFAVARTGDRVAGNAVAWAGRELGDLAVGVLRQLGFERRRFDVVLVGSLFNGGAPLLAPLRATIHAVAPGARLVRLQAPPVLGAVLLGMAQAGLDPAPARRPLARSLAALTPAAGVPPAPVPVQAPGAAPSPASAR